MKWMAVSKGYGRCRSAKFRWTINRYESLKNAYGNASREWTRRLNRACGQRGTGPDLDKKWWICDNFMKENVWFSKAWLAGWLAGWLNWLARLS